MAKIAKPKKRETSVHSRSFRRNATPPTEVAKPTKTNDENEHWLYNAQNAGVHKKTRSKKGTTRQQHMRHVKALEKADRNSAVLENKITKSKIRGKKIQARAKDWDELNEELVAKNDAVQKTPLPTTNEAAEMEGVEEEPAIVEAPAEASAGVSATITAPVEPVNGHVSSQVPQEPAADKGDDLDTIT